jgi:hypothetical protein
MVKPLAIITADQGYDGFVDGLRARADQLNVSRVTIDHVSGLTPGYAAKLLALPPIKTVGRASFGPILGALGLAIQLVEDLDAMRRIAARLEPRDTSQVRDTKQARMRRAEQYLQAFQRARAAEGGKARAAKLTPEQRSASARKAINARWAAVRKARRASRNAPRDRPQ